MKVSIIIPVLNSHEVVRRHLLYWSRMNLPDDVEILLLDDGSDPPLWEPGGLGIHPTVWDERWLPLDPRVRFLSTEEKRPWTSSIARNRGAEKAKGRNLLMADVDYIIPEKAIMEVRAFTGDRMQFIREFGVLDEEGRFTQAPEVLFDYGLPPSRYQQRGVRVPPHPNIYAMNRDVFFDLGGYDEDLVLRRRYPQGEDNQFKRRWARYEKAGKAKTDPHRPTVYMFPVGYFCGDVDFNPHGLFHNLSRKTRGNVFWKRQLRKEAR